MFQILLLDIGAKSGVVSLPLAKLGYQVRIIFSNIKCQKVCIKVFVKIYIQSIVICKKKIYSNNTYFLKNISYDKISILLSQCSKAFSKLIHQLIMWILIGMKTWKTYSSKGHYYYLCFVLHMYSNLKVKLFRFWSVRPYIHNKVI